MDFVISLREDAQKGRVCVNELLPKTKEAWGVIFMVENLARIYMMVGDFDAAIDQLEPLLSITKELSIPLLLLDSLWDHLRDHRRFKKLIEAGK